jgi:mRNA-degrading endonuclease RelE of RelBE toxin-antitoxin system
MGHPVHEFSESGLREVHEGGYRIIYGFQDKEFQVVTIIHMNHQITRRRLR